MKLKKKLKKLKLKDFTAFFIVVGSMIALNLINVLSASKKQALIGHTIFLIILGSVFCFFVWYFWREVKTESLILKIMLYFAVVIIIGLLIFLIIIQWKGLT